ncbi:MAG: mechanosensitive ion channel family protein [Acidobacteria bacterium]|nr:mechanosensitive ion channel family protein [Acidobacteriota bacterium]
MLTRRTCLAVVFLIVAFAAAQPARAWAQQTAAPAGAAEGQLEQEITTAPVMLDGVELFRVRGASSFPAAERAAAVAGRIEALAASPTFNPDNLHLEESEIGTQVMADRQVVLTVLDADARLEGIGRKPLAMVTVQRIRAAIVSYRADRTGPVLQRSAVRTLIATGLLLVVLVAIVWTWRRLDAALKARYGRKVEKLTAKSRHVVSVDSVWASLRTLIRFVRTALVIMLVFVYLQYVLALFPQTRPIAWSLTGYVIRPLAKLWEAFTTAIPDLMFLAVLFVVVRFLLKLIHRFFDAVDEGRIEFAHFEREWAIPTYKLLRVLVVAFAIVVGFPYIPGSSSDAFKGVSLFLGVMFSLGSSSLLANVLAGYSLNYRRAFKVGDRVKIGDVAGEVSAVRLQVTHVRTIRNEEVTVPNSVVLGTHVVNYSALARAKGLILTTTVGIGYETPWRQVEAMLIEAARRTPGLLPEPPPFIRQQALGDFAVTYALCVYTDQPLKMEAIYTDLHRNVLDVFNEYGVQIMTPAYEGDPEIPKVVPKDQWFAAPATAEPPRDRKDSKG